MPIIQQNNPIDQVPTVVALQPWMVEAGLYVADDDFLPPMQLANVVVTQPTSAPASQPIYAGTLRCPVVTSYPVITWNSPTSSTFAPAMVLDTTRRRLMVQLQESGGHLYADFDVVSTASNSFVTEYVGLRPPSSVIPFGSFEMGYDPVNDLVVIVDRSGNWVRFDPSSNTFSTAGACSATLGADNRYYRLSVDTNRGHVLGVNYASGSPVFQVVQITKNAFTSLNTSSGPSGQTFQNSAYSQLADRYALTLVGNNPPLYYVDPVTYAGTLSTVNETCGSGRIVALKDTPWVAFDRSDGHIVIVDVSTDTEYWVTTSAYPGFGLYDITYNSCTGIMYVAGETGYSRWNLTTKSFVDSTADNLYTVEFDEYSNLVYGLQTIGSFVNSHTIVTI